MAFKRNENKNFTYMKNKILYNVNECNDNITLKFFNLMFYMRKIGFMSIMIEIRV